MQKILLFSTASKKLILKTYIDLVFNGRWTLNPLDIVI